MRTEGQNDREAQRFKQAGIERGRQLRGLLTHYRALPETMRPGQYRRALIRTFPPLRHKDGRCRWCRRETKGRAFAWHPYCVNAYRAALGVPVGGGGQMLKPREECSCGRPGEELDHVTALVVAYASGDERQVLRAYTLDNLQWLCRRCHAEKSGNDRRTANNLKHGRPPGWRKPQPGDVPPGQMALILQE